MFEEIISIENLLQAWKEFAPGKSKKGDIQLFSLRLMDNLRSLHEDLGNYTLKHGTYQEFTIQDPKTRRISKATVRDRLLHRAMYRVLYPFFDKYFVADSFSCRKNKGTHRAMNRFQTFAAKVSANHTRTCWVLKCDIKKFFASIDHQVLMRILRRYTDDEHLLWLFDLVIESFNSGQEGKGLPLGNVTSQLLVNVYMNEFDQFVKKACKINYYVRYADDFVFLSDDRSQLEALLPVITEFLHAKLRLQLHPEKVFIKTYASGVDFLGWVHFPDHRVVRTTTKRRIYQKISKNRNNETLQSYLGLLKHGNTEQIKNELLKRYLLNDDSEH